MTDQGDILLCDLVQAYAPKSGGVKRYVHDKMRFFANLPHVRHMLVAPGRRDARSEHEQGSMHYVASPPIPFSGAYRLPLRTGYMAALLREHHPDVVEVDNPYHVAWAAIAASRDAGFKVVGFYHSDFPRSLGSKLDEWLKMERLRPFDRTLAPLIQHYLRSVYNRMDAVVTATRDFQELLHSFGVNNVVQVPLGTDTDVFMPRSDAREELLQELGIPDESMLLLYVGRFAGMKNLPELLEAVQTVHDDPETGRPVHLVCIGEGEYADVVEAAAAKCPCVHRLPYLADQQELARWYAGADLFAHAGDKETFGLVSVEAQACGTRVLAVRDGGMDSTLEGEEPLIMAKSPATEDLVAALREIMRLDPEQEKGARAAARRQRIRQRFSRESSFCKLLGLYRHLAAGGAAASFDGSFAWDRPCVSDKKSPDSPIG